MEEYVRLIASVKNALQQRSDKKAEYLASLTDVEAKQIAHNKVAQATSKEDQASVKLVSHVDEIKHYQYRIKCLKMHMNPRWK